MTRDEIVEKLNKRMKALNKNLSVKYSRESVFGDFDIDLLYDGKPQAWFFQCETCCEFNITVIEYLSSYIKHSEALVQFYVYGQKLLEELE